MACHLGFPMVWTTFVITPEEKQASEEVEMPKGKYDFIQDTLSKLNPIQIQIYRQVRQTDKKLEILLAILRAKLLFGFLSEFIILFNEASIKSYSILKSVPFCSYQMETFPTFGTIL